MAVYKAKIHNPVAKPPPAVKPAPKSADK